MHRKGPETRFIWNWSTFHSVSSVLPAHDHRICLKSSLLSCDMSTQNPGDPVILPNLGPMHKRSMAGGWPAQLPWR